MVIFCCMSSFKTKPIFSIIFVTIFLFFFGKVATAQLVIDQTLTPQQLVQQILVGSGVTVSNVTYTGNLGNAIGSFENGETTNLGLSSGIVLSSGNVAQIPGIAGTQTNPNIITTGNGTLGDTDLNHLLPPPPLGQDPDTTRDASTLEFDFIPQSDTLTFRYVFGSEEYPNFVNQFNDIFAFFISGPNPNGTPYEKENIALIPGTNLPVSIDNVNNGTSNAGPCVNCEYYINNWGGLTIAFNGFTTVLTAEVVVIPCSTYHMKLSIADVNDGAYDSGVFLEANSFSATGLSINTEFTSSSTSYASFIEGCNDATLNF